MSSLTAFPYHVYCNNVQNGAFAFHKFGTPDALRTFLDMCILQRSTRWDVYRIYPSAPSSEPQLTVLDADNEPLFTFRGTGIEDAMELTKYTPGTFSPQHQGMFESFARGGAPERTPAPAASITPSADITPAEPKAPRPLKTPKAPKPAGLISASDIAAKMKLDPKQVRDALRKSQTPKPDAGWNFTPQAATDIAKIIAANLKPGTDFTPYQG